MKINLYVFSGDIGASNYDIEYLMSYALPDSTLVPTTRAIVSYSEELNGQSHENFYSVCYKTTCFVDDVFVGYDLYLRWLGASPGDTLSTLDSMGII